MPLLEGVFQHETTMIRNLFMIKPPQRRLAGTVSHYRHLGRKKVRLNACSASKSRLSLGKQIYYILL
jgi:hypothetical protein